MNEVRGEQQRVLLALPASPYQICHVFWRIRGNGNKGVDTAASNLDWRASDNWHLSANQKIVDILAPTHYLSTYQTMLRLPPGAPTCTQTSIDVVDGLRVLGVRKDLEKSADGMDAPCWSFSPSSCYLRYPASF